jgi:DNA-binding CsgD family transcriptional regulator
MADELSSLSEREVEVMKLVATGASNQQIARSLVISPNTVKVHLRNIFEKLGVQSRTEATMAAVRSGLVPVPPGMLLPGELLGEAAPPVVPVESVPMPEWPALPGVPRWQRLYLVAATLLVLAAAFAPWGQRSSASRLTPFSDLGRAHTAPLPRPAVSRWVARAPLSVPRTRLAIAQVAGKIYAIGGESAAGISGELSIYDPDSNGWLTGAPKPIPAANISAAVLDGLVYVPGGSTATGGGNTPAALSSPLRAQAVSASAVTAEVEAYDPRSNRWQDRAPLPSPLAAYALVAQGEYLYVFGGWDGSNYRANSYRYDPKTDRWEALSPMPGARAFAAVGVLGGLLYVVGGYDGRTELDSVYAYDPAAEGTGASPWSRRASLNQARAGLSLVTVGSRLYAVGGGWFNDLAFNEQYDAVTGAWSRIETPVVGQWRNLGLVALGNKLYAVGGWGGSYLAINEEYQALFLVVLPNLNAKESP